MDSIKQNYYRRGTIEVWDFVSDQGLGFLSLSFSTLKTQNRRQILLV